VLNLRDKTNSLIFRKMKSGEMKSGRDEKRMGRKQCGRGFIEHS